MGQDWVDVLPTTTASLAPAKAREPTARCGRTFAPVLGLLVLLTVASPRALADEPAADPLDEARALLAGGDLEGAARAARAVIAAAPERGSGHLVLGLAYFRAGRYEEALAEFAAARTSALPAAAGAATFNEGAALFALGRYQPARTAFDQAARLAPELAFLAATDAAEAMLAAEDLFEARRYVRAAEALATTAQRQQMVRELAARIEREAVETQAAARARRLGQARAALAADRPTEAARLYQAALGDREPPALTPAERNVLEYGHGLALYRQRRNAEAAEHFARAAALDPNDGDSLYMQALAAEAAGDLATARSLYRQALRRDLDAATVRSLRDHLDRLSFGLRRGGAGGSAELSLGNGYDSNVIQGADARPESITPDQVGSAGAFMLTATANLGYAWLLGAKGGLAADYALDQLAYPDADHESYSLQDHNLRLRAEWSPSPLYHLGITGNEELQFIGLTSYRPYQNLLGVEPSLTVDELPYTSTSLRLRAQRKTALDSDYAYFGGTRLELRLGQRLRWRAWRAELALRHRRERIGVRTATLLEIGTTQSFKFRKRNSTDPPDQASYVYVTPYSYDANAVLASIETAVGPIRFNADGSAELLGFRGDSTVYFVVPTMNVNRLYQSGSRQDLRLSGAFAVTGSLTKHVDLVLRYEVTDNRSTLVLDVDDRNYWKHVVSLALEADW